MKEAGMGRGMGMFARRRISAGQVFFSEPSPPIITARPSQVMWTEYPLISYKKQAAGEDLEAYVDSLHRVFCQLDETAQAKLLDMYGPEEEPGRHGLKWRLFRCLFRS